MGSSTSSDVNHGPPADLYNKKRKHQSIGRQKKQKKSSQTDRYEDDEKKESGTVSPLQSPECPRRKSRHESIKTTRSAKTATTMSSTTTSTTSSTTRSTRSAVKSAKQKGANFVLKSQTGSVKSMTLCTQPLLDFSIDRGSVDDAISILDEYPLPIIGVWLVTRPINRINNGKFTHWAVNLHCLDILVTMDFFEKKGKGAFGVYVRPASWENLDNFLFYFKKDLETGEWKAIPWTIETVIVPRLKYRDIHPKDSGMAAEISDVFLEKQEIIDRESVGDGPDLDEDAVERDLMTRIKFSPRASRLSDLSAFMNGWHTQSGGKYNAISNNCQRFAFDLMSFILNTDDRNHRERITSLGTKMQSWSDFVREKNKWQESEKERRRQLKRQKKKAAEIQDKYNDF